MSKSSIVGLLLLVAFCACKSTSTNPLDGQKLRLISSDLDTTSVVSGPVPFTVTVLQPSGYGASGAYIDFYDPIEQRARHEGPTPEDGTWEFTDTIPSTLGGGSFEFAFVAEDAGAITSDSLKLLINAKDIRPWVIDSIQANSWSEKQIGVQWSRPAIDSGADTIFVQTSTGIVIPPFVEQYPQNAAVIFVSEVGTDTITVHNAYASSRSIVWAPAYFSSDIDLYPNGDSNYDFNSGLYFAYGNSVSLYANYGFRPLVDLVLATDPSNHNSGYTIVSPSLSSLSGFSGGKTTKLYHPVQYIDSGFGLQQLYYPSDLFTYVNGVTPIYEIQLPDSNQYSTAFIAVTEEGNYAQVSIGPVMHDWENYPFVNVAISYQPVRFSLCRAGTKALKSSSPAPLHRRRCSLLREGSC